MKQCFLLIIMCFALKGYAQNEFSTKFKAIAPKNTTEAPKKITPIKADNAPLIKAPSVFDKPEENVPLNPKYEIGKPKSIS
ncbi:MAG: hypothetical protein ABI554_01230, partial [Flavobacterium sp.]